METLLEVIKFNVIDIVTTSNDDGDETDFDPF